MDNEKINIKYLTKLFEIPKETLLFAIRNNIIVKCVQCIHKSCRSKNVSYWSYKSSKTNLYWACNKCRNKSKMNYIFFNNCKVKLRDIIFILYYYFQEDINYNRLLHEVDLNSSDTLSKLLQKIRNSVTKWGQELNKEKLVVLGKL